MKRQILVLFALALLSGVLFAQSSKNKVSPRIHKMIASTIKETQANLYDYNRDGEINCRDYSCIFKRTWDRKFPEEKALCTLVRNYQPGVMCHLFVNVRDDNYCAIEVEPQAYSPQHYLMTENWPRSMYDSAFNNYGETEEWLSEGQYIASSYSGGVANSGGASYGSTSCEECDMGYFSVGYMGCLSFEDSDDSCFISQEKYGLEFSFETPVYQDGFFIIFAFDYLTDGEREHPVHSVLTGVDVGYCFHPVFQPYVGSFAGVKWTDTFSMENVGFAWKVCGGSRFAFSSFCVRAEISYGSILGPAGMVSLGFGI